LIPDPFSSLLMDALYLILILVGWIVLMRWVLPRFGVGT
jgi:hypothetical protein